MKSKDDALDPYAASLGATGAGGKLMVIIETPQGSRSKFAFDPEHKLFKLKKVLPAGAVFPYNFGYVPGTLGADGDPLDVLVLMDEPAFTGCLVEARLIGVIEAKQTERDQTRAVRNDRLLAVALASQAHGAVRDLDGVSPALLQEIEQFFINYNYAEGKGFKPLGCRGRKQALRLLRKGVNAHRKQA